MASFLGTVQLAGVACGLAVLLLAETFRFRGIASKKRRPRQGSCFTTTG